MTAAHSGVLLEQLPLEAHVWFTAPERLRDPGTLDDCLAMLCEQERERYRRFHFPADRHRFLVSHALVRCVLSRYLDLSPADWTFRNGEHGRPEISNPGLPALRFNLTHTDGLAACVVTLACDCGIDAERIVARHNPAGIAQRMFSAAECEQLQRLNGREQLEYFFRRWTLREAYVKARGIGIAFPTRKLQFAIDEQDSIQVEFAGGIDDTGKCWQFRLLYPTRQHIAALALGLDDSSDRRIVSREFTW
jgi:4'-phosphopantetheinyl transferase